MSKFVDVFLRNDGVFLLRLIASNAGDLITTDIVKELWLQFLNEEADKAKTLPLPIAPSLTGNPYSAEPKTGNLEEVDTGNGPYGDTEKQRLT